VAEAFHSVTFDQKCWNYLCIMANSSFTVFLGDPGRKKKKENYPITTRSQTKHVSSPTHPTPSIRWQEKAFPYRNSRDNPLCSSKLAV
jgi:hypothetical protein